MTALVFDTELSNKKNGEIVEAAYIRLSARMDLAGTVDTIDLAIQGEYLGRFKPNGPMTMGSLAIHHILPDELEGCQPSSSFRLPDDCRYIIGHSIDNDWEAAGSPAHIKRIDTHAIAQWLWPEATGYSQTALIYLLEGLTPETRAMVRGAHNALADARLNYGLLRHILKRKPEIQTWSELWAYSEECRIPRTCPLRRWQDVPLDQMDDSAIDWCLSQYWLDPYFRKGLERVWEKRYGSGEGDESNFLPEAADCA